MELPGIEPVSPCWSQGRTRSELRNYIICDSPELTSMDTDCAQNVPTGTSASTAATHSNTLARAVFTRTVPCRRSWTRWASAIARGTAPWRCRLRPVGQLGPLIRGAHRRTCRPELARVIRRP